MDDECRLINHFLKEELWSSVSWDDEKKRFSVESGDPRTEDVIGRGVTIEKAIQDYYKRLRDRFEAEEE